MDTDRVLLGAMNSLRTADTRNFKLVSNRQDRSPDSVIQTRWSLSSFCQRRLGNPGCPSPIEWATPHVILPICIPGPSLRHMLPSRLPVTCKTVKPSPTKRRVFFCSPRTKKRVFLPGPTPKGINFFAPPLRLGSYLHVLLQTLMPSAPNRAI